LIGIPLRITIGSKGLKEGIVEMKWRNQKTVTKLPLVDAEAWVAAAVVEASSRA